MDRIMFSRRRLSTFIGVGLTTVAFGPRLPFQTEPANAQSSAQIKVPEPGSSSTVDRIKKAKAFRAGIAVAAPWLLLDPKSHEYRGASITFAEAIAKALDVSVQYVPSNWDVIIAGLQANKFDAIMAPLFATEARKQVVDFVNYTSAGTCYVVLKDNKKITDLDSLNDPNVSVETYTGTGNEQGFVKKYPKAHDYSITPPLGGAVNVIDVLNKRVDALAINSTDGVWITDQYPSVRILPKDPVYCENNPDIPFPIGMAYRKGDNSFGEFATAIAKAIGPQMQEEIVKYSSPEFMKGQ